MGTETTQRFRVAVVGLADGVLLGIFSSRAAVAVIQGIGFADESRPLLKAKVRAGPDFEEQVRAQADELLERAEEEHPFPYEAEENEAAARKALGQAVLRVEV